MSAPDLTRAAAPPVLHGETKGHEGHHHDHAHHHGEAPFSASRNVSILALSGGQRLILTIPAIGVLWVLALWAMGSL